MIVKRAGGQHRPRTRLPADVARTRILEAAEKQLIEGGPHGVRVQVLARELGLSDAAIYHHFGSRAGLLNALLRFGGRRLRAEIERVTSGWDASDLDLEPLMQAVLEVFEGRGYARLALWLWSEGFRDRGRGFFDDFVSAVALARRAHARILGRPAPSDDEARRLAGLFAAILISEPILGEASRRSVSLPGGAAASAEYRRWLARTFRRLILSPDPEGA